MGTQSDLYQSVTDRIVAALEAGTAPWVRPWKSDRSGEGTDAAHTADVQRMRDMGRWSRADWLPSAAVQFSEVEG